MLILVCMLMRCLRNSAFDRRYMAEAALAMRDVMSREDEPSFVIKDPRYVKESTNSTSVLVEELRDFLCTFVYKHEIWHRCRPEHTELIF